MSVFSFHIFTHIFHSSGLFVYFIMNLMYTGHIYLICRCTFTGKRWVWKGGFICTKMTPPPNLGHFWVVFEGWSQILFSTKLFRHRFEQSCSAMATQKLKGKVQQHDEVVESSKPGCRSQSRARISKTFVHEGFQSMCVHYGKAV